MPASNAEFVDLENRINTSLQVVAALELTHRNPHYQRSLLLTRTLLCCAIIQLRGYVYTPGDDSWVIMVHAAANAVDGLNSVDISKLVFVDPVNGVRFIISSRQRC